MINFYFVTGSYKVGKDIVPIQIALENGYKIYVDDSSFKEKRLILATIYPEYQHLFTNDPAYARIHIFPLYNKNVSLYQQHILKARKKRAVVFKLSAQERVPKDKIIDVRKITDSVTQFIGQYSAHSSFTELGDFVKWM